MYVVIEWNQASGRPRLADDTLYDLEAEAVDAAKDLAAIAFPRHENYTVHAVDDDRLFKATPQSVRAEARVPS